MVLPASHPLEAASGLQFFQHHLELQPDRALIVAPSVARPISTISCIGSSSVPSLLCRPGRVHVTVNNNSFRALNQGLAWSTTVIMMIDLAGPRQRGLAMGVNEFAGYVAVALSALGTGYVAQAFGLRPEPFYMGIAFAAVGLGLSAAFLRETREYARTEAGPRASAGASVLSTRELLALTLWRHPALSSASQAGLVNNLNDGVAWGLFPLFFAASGLGFADIGLLSFIYPFTWGVLQLWTGAWSDRVGRKRLIAGGMLIQALALGSIAMTNGFAGWFGAAAVLGVGTAMVYPTLLASVGDVADPNWRGSAVGVYRLWRDSGYAVGAVIAGTLADAFGMRAAIGAVAVLTGLSGFLVAWRMPETLKRGN